MPTEALLPEKLQLSTTISPETSPILTVRALLPLLLAVQFLTVALISGAAALIAGEKCDSGSISGAVTPILYCGIIAIGFACTVQVAAQKYVHPATASIILSTASVFAVIWGCLILNEKYSLLNLIGCAILFGATILVQLPCANSEAMEKDCVTNKK